VRSIGRPGRRPTCRPIDLTANGANAALFAGLPGGKFGEPLYVDPVSGNLSGLPANCGVLVPLAVLRRSARSAHGRCPRRPARRHASSAWVKSGGIGFVPSTVRFSPTADAPLHCSGLAGRVTSRPLRRSKAAVLYDDLVGAAE